ncbi:50S ribosomal protein L22 [Candidatus Azambacteria bacterium]|nr:50S ribosomal protein L22 [Candidatus Azambacteria bacterium]
MSEVKASLNHLRMAPRKVRLVADLIRGKSIVTAVNQLRFLVKKAGGPILKLLNSAIANAKNLNLSNENFYIKQIIIDEGPALKRQRPRAMGRSNMIKKRTSHVTLVLNSKEEKDKKIKKSKKE